MEHEPMLTPEGLARSMCRYLNMTPPFTARAFADALARSWNIKIATEPCPNGEYTTGWCVAQGKAYTIYYYAGGSVVQRERILFHELCHIAMGHLRGPAGGGDASRIGSRGSGARRRAGGWRAGRLRHAGRVAEDARAAGPPSPRMGSSSIACWQGDPMRVFMVGAGILLLLSAVRIRAQARTRATALYLASIACGGLGVIVWVPDNSLALDSLLHTPGVGHLLTIWLISLCFILQFAFMTALTRHWNRLSLARVSSMRSCSACSPSPGWLCI